MTAQRSNGFARFFPSGQPDLANPNIAQSSKLITKSTKSHFSQVTSYPRKKTGLVACCRADSDADMPLWRGGVRDDQNWFRRGGYFGWQSSNDRNRY